MVRIKTKDEHCHDHSEVSDSDSVSESKNSSDTDHGSSHMHQIFFFEGLKFKSKRNGHGLLHSMRKLSFNIQQIRAEPES